MSTITQTVLLATDGSEDAALALKAAVDIAAKSGAALSLVHVYVPELGYAGLGLGLPPEGYVDEHKQRAREILEGEAKKAAAAGAKLSGEYLRAGRTWEQIVDLAEEIEAGLIVMGARGTGAVKRLSLGSVSGEVARHAPCPVLVVRGGKDAWPPSRIVVGEDSSEESRRASELSTALAGLFGLSPLLVRVVPPSLSSRDATPQEEQLVADGLRANEERLRDAADKLRERFGVDCDTRVAEGEAAAIVLEAANSDTNEASTLIALGGRGLGGATRHSELGSTSTDVLHAAAGPVLLVDPA